jgi:signal transduction histidine kinase
MGPEALTRRPTGPAHDTAQAHRDKRRAWAGFAFHVVVLGTMLTAVTLRQGHEEFPGPTLLVFTVLSWLPLLARTRWPLAVLGATVLAESLHLVVVPFVDPGLSTPIAIAAYQPVPLATMGAAWTVATRLPRAYAWGGGGLAAVILLIVSLVSRPHSLIATDMVMFDLVVIATAIGRAIRGRRERLERAARQRQAETHAEVVAERLRIARDLHDVLAHHLTLVNAQAGVAGYLMRTDLPAASTALQDISTHTRRALDELRATVGLLRQDGETAEPEGRRPVPGLERLDELLGGFRSAGAVITLRVTGRPGPLAAGADPAAYRIVQEALTNATKHAPGAGIAVHLHWSPRALELRIENQPAPHRARALPAPGTGHGLIGMRERAGSCGGLLDTRWTPEGGFAVTATLPAEAAGAESPTTGRLAP